jgi:hypothetical protein
MRQYGFHYRFSADILSGKKSMTIRRVWKKPVKKGDPLRLHVDIPERGETVVLKAYCSNAYPVSVSSEAVMIGARKLSSSEIRTFLRKDGFRSVADMKAFFEERYSLPFSGQCICWRLCSGAHLKS